MRVLRRPPRPIPSATARLKFVLVKTAPARESVTRISFRQRLERYLKRAAGHHRGVRNNCNNVANLNDIWRGFFPNRLCKIIWRIQTGLYRGVVRRRSRKTGKSSLSATASVGFCGDCGSPAVNSICGAFGNL